MRLRSLRNPSLGAVIAIAALAGSAASADAKARTLAHSSASGDYAIASVSTTDNHPVTIELQVQAAPNQKVQVSWDLVCNRGLSAGSKSGQYTARTPTVKVLPQPMSHDSSCIVSANAQLQTGGVVKIAILN